MCENIFVSDSSQIEMEMAAGNAAKQPDLASSKAGADQGLCGGFEEGGQDGDGGAGQDGHGRAEPRPVLVSKVRTSRAKKTKKGAGGACGRGGDCPSRKLKEEATGKAKRLVRRRREGPSSLTRLSWKPCRCNPGSKRKRVETEKEIRRPDAEPDVELRLVLWGEESVKEGEECFQKRPLPAFPDRSSCRAGWEMKWKSITGFVAHLRQSHPDLVFCVYGGRVYCRRRRLTSLSSDISDGLTLQWLQANVGLPDNAAIFPRGLGMPPNDGDSWSSFRWRNLTEICGFVDPAKDGLVAMVNKAFSQTAAPVGEIEQQVGKILKKRKIRKIQQES